MQGGKEIKKSYSQDRGDRLWFQLQNWVNKGRQLDFVESKQETRGPAPNSGWKISWELPQLLQLIAPTNHKASCWRQWESRYMSLDSNPSLDITAGGSTIYQHNHSLNHLDQFFEKQKCRAVLIICHLFVSAASWPVPVQCIIGKMPLEDVLAALTSVLEQKKTTCLWLLLNNG